jgi:hypothetical protein
METILVSFPFFYFETQRYFTILKLTTTELLNLKLLKAKTN